MKSDLMETRQFHITPIIVIVTLISMIPIIFYSENTVEQICIISDFILLLYVALKTRIIYNRKCLLFIIFCSLSLLLTVAFYQGQGVAITFLNSFTCTLIFNNFGVNYNSFKYIHVIPAIILTIFLLTCDLQYGYAGLVYTVLGTRININMFGLFSLACFFHWMCFLQAIEIHKVLLTIVTLCLLVLLGYYIWISGCRSALLALVIFFVLFFVKKQPFQYYNFLKITTIILLASIIFVWMYLSLSERTSNSTILGKSLFSGRQIVWKSALELFNKSPIIGNGTSVMLHSVHSTSTASAHNTILSILYTIGIIPAITFVYWIVRRVKLNCGIYNRVAQFAFLSSLVVCFFESFLIESRLYLLFLLFLIPINLENQDV